MPKFEVRIQRTYIHSTVITVEAEDNREAEQIALDRISDEVLDNIDCGLPDEDAAIVLRSL